MTQLSIHRKLALAAALVSALSLAGATLAASPNPHASPTAVTHPNGTDTDTDTDTDTSDNSAHGDAVSAAAQSDLTGGPHNNHGGYVSCIARGGSDCTTTTPTLPSHGDASTHSKGHATTP